MLALSNLWLFVGPHAYEANKGNHHGGQVWAPRNSTMPFWLPQACQKYWNINMSRAWLCLFSVLVFVRRENLSLICCCRPLVPEYLWLPDFIALWMLWYHSGGRDVDTNIFNAVLVDQTCHRSNPSHVIHWQFRFRQSKLEYLLALILLSSWYSPPSILGASLAEHQVWSEQQIVNLPDISQVFYAY